MLSSTDGQQWIRQDTTAMGPGTIMGGTVDRQGQVVLLGEVPSGQRTGSKNFTKIYCPLLWTGRVNGPLTRGDVGCQAGPMTAVATLADGRYDRRWQGSVGPRLKWGRPEAQGQQIEDKQTYTAPRP